MEEHSSANPNVPSSIPGRSHTGVTEYNEAGKMHLTPVVVHNFPKMFVYRISVPYSQKDPRFLFEKRRGQPWEFWSLISTIDSRTLPQDSSQNKR